MGTVVAGAPVGRRVGRGAGSFVVQQVAEEGQVAGTRRSRNVDHVGTHRLLGAGDPVGPLQERVAQRPVGAHLGVEGGGVEGLVVLAPADRADEALVADQKLGPAEREGHRPPLQASRRLVDRGERGIGDDRPVADAVVEAAVAEVPIGAVVADRSHVLRFKQKGEASVGLGLQLEGRAQGRGERVVVEGVVVGLLDTVAETERDVRVADGLSEGRGFRRRALVFLLRERRPRAGERRQRKQNQTLAHDRGRHFGGRFGTPTGGGSIHRGSVGTCGTGAASNFAKPGSRARRALRAATGLRGPRPRSATTRRVPGSSPATRASDRRRP